MNTLLDKNTSRAMKKGALVEEIMHRHTFKTIAVTDEIYQFDGGIYVTGGADVINSELETLGGFEIDNHMRKEVAATIMARTRVSKDKFDNYPHWVHVENGWINYTSREFKEHDAEMLSLMKVPHSYNPDFTNHEQQKFFGSIFEEGDLDAVQKFFGYLLLPDQRFKKAFMGVGPKDTGKSKFLELVEVFVGTASHVGLHDMSANNHIVADITKSIVNTASELPKYQLKDVSLFKAITGGDERTFREIYGKPFQTKVRAKFLMATNDLPSFEGMDRTFIERWVVFRFSNVFTSGEDMDVKIMDKLTTPEEMSGLLNYALEGLGRLLADGYFKNENYETLKGNWETISSKIGDYLQQHCVRGDNLSIPSDALYEDYRLKTENPLSNSMFGRELKKAGINPRQVRDGDSRMRKYVGITTRTDVEQERFVTGVTRNLRTIDSEESPCAEGKVQELPVTPVTEFSNETIQCPCCPVRVASEKDLETHAVMKHTEPVMDEYYRNKRGTST